MADIILICLPLLMMVGGIWGYFSEQRRWNNGISPSGKPWRLFDHDSQGGRGYTDGTFYCWISWPGIDRPAVKK